MASQRQQPPPNKVQKTTPSLTTTSSGSRAGFELLNDDALRAVLLRTNASDHNNLRVCCHRIRTILDDKQFIQERCESGYAEVSCVIPTPFEQYKETSAEIMGNDEASVTSQDSEFADEYNSIGYTGNGYGISTFTAKIVVDGKDAGSADILLLPRSDEDREYVNFHEVCDVVSSDTYDVGVTFFDRRGMPRINSVKEALNGEDVYNRKPLLYVKTFALKPVYHATTTTTSTVGSKALRSLLNDTSLFQQWGIAIYIPECRPHFTDDDRKMQMTIEEMRRGAMMADSGLADDVDIPSDEDLQIQRNWKERCNDLTQIDMRQFLRAGFLQVKETVNSGASCYYLFTIPSLFQKDMMSHHDAQAIEILEKPKPPPEPSYGARKLLCIMTKFCKEHRSVESSLKNVRRQQQRPLRENPQLNEIMEKADKNIALSLEGIRKLESRIQAINDASERMSKSISEAEILISETDNIAKGAVAGSVKEKAQQLLQTLTENKESYDNENRQCLEESTELLKETRGALASIEVLKQQAQDMFIQGLREEASTLKQKLQDIAANVRTKVMELVESGRITGDGDDNDRGNADIIVESDAIHCCAAHFVPSYVELLMSFIDQDKKIEVINALDVNGWTPLMVAAASAAAGAGSPPRLETCKKIIALGGDTCVVVPASGLSALGLFRGGRRSMLDFLGSFGGSAIENEVAVLALEALITPRMGPTEADRAMLVSEEHVASDEGDGDDDDDFDDEEAEEEEDGVAED